LTHVGQEIDEVTHPHLSETTVIEPHETYQDQFNSETVPFHVVSTEPTTVDRRTVVAPTIRTTGPIVAGAAVAVPDTYVGKKEGA
jgi:hypothetical protein